MESLKQAEEAIVTSRSETELGSIVKGDDEESSIQDDQARFNMKTLLWHGGSVYDAWFSCASNQVRQ